MADGRVREVSPHRRAHLLVVRLVGVAAHSDGRVRQPTHANQHGRPDVGIRRHDLDPSDLSGKGGAALLPVLASASGAAAETITGSGGAAAVCCASGAAPIAPRGGTSAAAGCCGRGAAGAAGAAATACGDAPTAPRETDASTSCASVSRGSGASTPLLLALRSTSSATMALAARRSSCGSMLKWSPCTPAPA
eukprot:scaffold89726_cov66-Phaeocystis_antarctica.AAC.3